MLINNNLEGIYIMVNQVENPSMIKVTTTKPKDYEVVRTISVVVLAVFFMWYSLIIV